MNTMVRLLLKRGVVTDLARLPHSLDLASPSMAATINSALKPLETLSRIGMLKFGFEDAIHFCDAYFVFCQYLKSTPNSINSPLYCKTSGIKLDIRISVNQPQTIPANKSAAQRVTSLSQPQPLQPLVSEQSQDTGTQSKI